MTGRRSISLLLSFLTGFLALSLEMIWIRIVEYTQHGSANSFGFVLCAFLLGISVGAFFAGRLTLKKEIDIFPLIAFLLITAALLSYISIPLVAEAVTSSYALGLGLCLLLIAMVAATYGMIFPLLCHVAGNPNETAGRTVSQVYMANILGATLSPLLTGLYLLDHFSLSSIVATITTMSALIALLIALELLNSNRRRLLLIAALGIGFVLLLHGHDNFYRDIYAKLLFKEKWHKNQPFKYVVENRSGLITVKAEKHGGDTIYGGGVWDGRFQFTPVVDVNGIRRAFRIAALHPDPSEVLMVGLASGSWAVVMDAYEPIQSMDIVEINHGYSEVMRHYPNHARLFESDKVELHIDDGRRWLKRHPNRKFDLIVMDVTWHKRNNATNLLSVEFLRNVKSQLKPNGVVYYNTTDSEDVIFTAAQIFKHMVRQSDFIAASDTPFSMSQQQAWSNMQKFVKPPFQAMFKNHIKRQVLKGLAYAPLVDIGETYRARSDLTVITDNNMATEYRRADFTGGVTWLEFFDKIGGRQ